MVGPYMVVAKHDNAIYILRESDGTMLKIHVASKRIKIFKRIDGKFYADAITDFGTQEDDEVEEADSETNEDGNLHEYEED
jgi:hypothetical protein